jgi:hypothetical protein
MRDAGRGALLTYSDDDSVVAPAGNARDPGACAHEGSLADLGMRLCGLLAEVTGPSDEYWRNREATRGAISQVSALREHLASVDTRSRRFTRSAAELAVPSHARRVAVREGVELPCL